MLRRRRSWTVAELSGELKVSRRTALRDLQRLRGQGYEIAGTTGPAGGVSLSPNSVLLHSRLSTRHVIALVLSVQVARSSVALPFAADALEAVLKLEAALGVDARHDLRRLLARILVGEPLPQASVGAVAGELLDVFERGFRERRTLTFRYTKPQGTATQREVEPHGLLVRAPVWYVVAWDVDKQAPRLFRADRIEAIRVTPRGFGVRSELAVLAQTCPDARPVGPPTPR